MLKVLYVEDDQINALIMQIMLQEMVTLEIASDPETALEMVESQAFDLILMDINLGHNQVDGTELMRNMRQRWPRMQSIPFFAVTAYALPGDREAFLKQGFDEYFSKPVDKAALQATIRELHPSH
jgi:two-component system, cell cycle response regulator DivK